MPIIYHAIDGSRSEAKARIQALSRALFAAGAAMRFPTPASYERTAALSGFSPRVRSWLKTGCLRVQKSWRPEIGALAPLTTRQKPVESAEVALSRGEATGVQGHSRARYLMFAVRPCRWRGGFRPGPAPRLLPGDMWLRRCHRQRRPVRVNSGKQPVQPARRGPRPARSLLPGGSPTWGGFLDLSEASLLCFLQLADVATTHERRLATSHESPSFTDHYREFPAS